MTASPTRPPRVRDRTRGTLLTAAIEVLSKSPAAAMGDIATAAGVARSTLHRYFPDRSSLMESIESYVEAQYDEAIEAARIGEGTGLAAYTRIVDELLERIESLGWWMHTARDDGIDDFDCDADRGIMAVVARGQQDRTMDPQFTAEWIITIIWSLLSSAYQSLQHRQQPRREIREICRNALLKIAASPSPSSHLNATQ